MNLLDSLFSKVWLVDEATKVSIIPLLIKQANGENIEFVNERENLKPFAVWQRNNIRYYNYNDAPHGSIAVHAVIGTVRKYGYSGTEGLMQRMSAADEHKNISAHLIEFDSGGGEATNIETVARFIRNDLQKPVIAWFNGRCGSAAYYIAAAADEIYASEETDMVGSLGTLVTFADFTAYYEKMGVKIHTVYAPQSTEKNQDFEQAVQGKYDRLKKDFLAPYAQRFIDTVKEFRPDLTEESAYKGKIYMAPKAIEIGMIDGMKTWELAAERAAELSKINSSSIPNIMNIERINAALGVTLETQDGGVFLTEDQLDALNRKVSVEGTQVVNSKDLATISQGITKLQGTLTAMDTKITGLEDRMTSVEGEVKVIGEADGSTPAVPAADQDTDLGVQIGDESLKSGYLNDLKEMSAAAKDWKNNPFSGI